MTSNTRCKDIYNSMSISKKQESPKSIDIHILMLEDVATDAEIIEIELRKGGIAFVPKRVCTKKAFLKALEEFSPDLILADYSLPQFDGLSALLIAKEKRPKIPFLLVSGAIGEELAIEMLKQGATDYVLKSNLKRLVPAVKRALHEAKDNARRTLTERALRESEEKYRNVVERANDGITIIQDGTVKFLNKRLAELLGGNINEIVGTPFTDYIYHEVLAEVEDRYRRRMAGEEVSTTYETVLMRRDESKIYTEINAGIILYEGKPADLVIIRDITERKKAEELLNKSQKLLSETQRITKLGGWEYDVEKGRLIWTDEVYRIYGVSPNEYDPNDITQDMASYEDRAVIEEAFTRTVTLGEPYDLELKFRNAQGKRLWIRTSGNAEFVNHKVSRAYGNIMDITERKKTEEELRATRDYLEHLFNYANAPIIVWDHLLRITRFNRAFEHLAGYAADEVIGKELHILFPEESKEESLDKISRTSIGEFWESVEIPILRKKGDIRIALWNSANIYDNDGKTLLATIAQGQDITERKRAEEGMADEANRRRILMEQSRDGIVILDQNGKVYEANRQFAAMLGYSLEEVKHLQVWDWEDQWTPQQLLEMIRSVDATGDHFETRHYRKDGSLYDVEISTNGAVLGGQKLVFCVCRDISERKSAERALRQSEERLRVLMGNLPGMAYRCLNAPGWSMEFVSEGCRALTGYEPEEFMGKNAVPFEDTIHPEDRKDIYDKVQECVSTGRQFHLEYRIITKRGVEKYVWEQGQLVSDPGSEMQWLEGFIMDITEHRKAQEALRQREAELREAQRVASLGNWELDWETKIIIWSEEIYRIFRRNRTLPPPTYDELAQILASASKSQLDSSIDTTLETGNPFEIDLEVIRPDGTTGWITARGEIKCKDTHSVLLRGTALDITDRKKMEEELRASETELHDAYFSEATLNMILSESLNDQTLDKFLQKSLNMILSIPWIPLQPVGSISLVEDDKDALDMKAQNNIPEKQKDLFSRISFRKCLCEKAAQTQQMQFASHIDEQHEICCDEFPPHGHYAVPILFCGRKLGVINLYLKKGYIRNRKEEELLNSLADTLAGIIIRKKAEDRIQYLAYYDALTGLPNRNLFFDRLTQEIARAEYGKKPVAVVAVDIDRFKSINDAYGLEAGDAVLQEVAKRLLSSVRDGDTIARLGNDDFGVLLVDIADSSDIILVIDKIMKNVSHPILFDGKEIMLTLSAGISVYPDDGKEASSHMKNADRAIAKAKQQGRKNYQFYTQDMDVKATEFVQMEKDLFNAIKNEEFILHYQPYWDITTKKLIGVEALVRWKSPESGLISPGKFIPVLEDTRMIIEVGEWILRTAIRQVKEWQDKKYPIVPVSVNLSLIQFRQKDLSKMIEKIIKESGCCPSLLTLEITESAFMHDIDFTYSVLANLKRIGVSVSIDDFGTGYSSLAHLKRLPVDNLKIDMSFIREIATDPDTASIVTAIIAMAHTLNLKTIAEGIETEEQWKILQLLRCDMGQGYYFSKPLPAEEIEKFFKQK